MIDLLYQIDVTTFYFLNRTLANTFSDVFFVFITTEKNWFLVYVLAWFILLFKGGEHRILIAFSLLTLVLLTDQFSSVFLKQYIARVRPCSALQNVHLLVSCTNSGSFPSSHALNNFAVAAFISYFYKNLKWILFPVAFIVGLSRIFVGVHYPSDVLGGAILGIIMGFAFAILINAVAEFLERKQLFS